MAISDELAGPVGALGLGLVMTIEELFLQTLLDLEQRLLQADEYALLRAAALLRQLLLEEHPIAIEVNRSCRLKLTFTVTDMGPYFEMLLQDGATFYSTEDGLDPGTAPFGQSLYLTRDQFLKRRVMVVNGSILSVHDVIDQLAHIEGGVHVGTARTAKEKALKEAATAFRIGDLPGGTRMIAAIARVTLVALRDLRVAVQKDAP
ncbi:MAG TPA: hypothetical protein DEV93_15970 [Chloroflexi bacterium]|jgi:hypothetical protein|nr:hypothetical protein [Chloroflexota bacterium]